jgi:hypothetical protein
LTDFWKRMGKPNCLNFPMSHQDIADHLGLTIETLSRTITNLERSGIISANTASKFVVAAKSLIACAHDELRQRIVVLWSRTPPERDRGRPWPKAGFGLGRDLNQKTGDYVIGE